LARISDADATRATRSSISAPLVDDSPAPLQRDLHRVARQVDALVHARRHAHAPDELAGLDRLVVVAVRHDERDDEARLLVGAQQRQVLRSAHLHGDGAQRVDDRRAQRHQRQRRRQFGLEDLFLALGFGHDVREAESDGGCDGPGGRAPAAAASRAADGEGSATLVRKPRRAPEYDWGCGVSAPVHVARSTAALPPGAG
jgi:hypothetical protein